MFSGYPPSALEDCAAWFEKCPVQLNRYLTRKLYKWEHCSKLRTTKALTKHGRPQSHYVGGILLLHPREREKNARDDGSGHVPVGIESVGGVLPTERSPISVAAHLLEKTRLRRLRSVQLVAGWQGTLLTRHKCRTPAKVPKANRCWGGAIEQTSVIHVSSRDPNVV